ncbi:very short patch repair endonuclease [Qipengyuania atrilutea]|nr:very short patch repair endonuclease [Actirhodobacter atriluteus]
MVDQATRSRMMAAIKGRDTKPEMIVRRGLHRRGFRFRLHDRALPGRPDLIFPRHRAVIFVHGCFWHGHDCPFFRWPKSRPEFWRAKIGANIERDRAARTVLRAADWRVLTVWECAFRGKSPEHGEAALDEAAAWLSGSSGDAEIRGDDSGAG